MELLKIDKNTDILTIFIRGSLMEMLKIKDFNKKASLLTGF